MDLGDLVARILWDVSPVVIPLLNLGIYFVGYTRATNLRYRNGVSSLKINPHGLAMEHMHPGGPSSTQNFNHGLLASADGDWSSSCFHYAKDV